MWQIDFEQGRELLAKGLNEEAEARFAAAATQVDGETDGFAAVGDVHLGLADARRRQHRWVPALEALSKALLPLRKSSTPQDPRLTTALHQLGALIAYTGKASEAEPAFVECLNVTRKVANPRQLAAYLCVLADFYLFHRAPKRAAGHLQEAAGLLIQNFGPADAQGCHIQLAMGDVWDKIDRVSQALQLREALQTSVAADPALSFEVAYRRALAHKRRREWAPCLASLQACLQMTGEQDPRRVLLQSEIGNALLGSTRFGEAEGALVQGYQMAMAVLGAEHPQTAVCAADLARLWQGQGRLQEAEQGYQFAHSVLFQQLGEGNPLTLTLCDRLIECCIQRKDYMRAQLLTIETLKDRSRIFGDTHPLVAEALGLLGRVWLQQRQFGQAADVLAQALGMLSLYPSTGDFGTLLIRYSLGAALQGVYKYYEAEEHYRQVIQELEQFYGESHFLLPHVLRNLGWLLRQTGRDRAATDATARADALAR